MEMKSQNVRSEKGCYNESIMIQLFENVRLCKGGKIHMKKPINYKEKVIEMIVEIENETILRILYGILLGFKVDEK